MTVIFCPLLILVNICNRGKHVRPVDSRNSTSTVDTLRSVRLINSNKSWGPFDALKAVSYVNFSENVCSVN